MSEVESFQWEEGNLQKFSDFWLIQPKVRLDITFADRFFSKVNDLIGIQPAHVIIDMRYVPYISSSGIKAILSLKRFLNMRGYKISLIHLTEETKKIIIISEIENLLPIFVDQGEALEYFKSSD